MDMGLETWILFLRLPFLRFSSLANVSEFAMIFNSRYDDVSALPDQESCTLSSPAHSTLCFLIILTRCCLQTDQHTDDS